MLRLAALLTTLTALAITTATATAAEPQTETATSPTVTATFTHRDAGDGKWTDMNVTVVRAGVQVYSGVPKLKDCPAPYCAPFAPVGDEPSIKVLDVSGDGEPEVIVNFYSGGAHCCEIAWVLRWTGTTYKPAERNFADFGYTIVPAASADFPAAFVTGDARFAYEFASFADSAFPLRVFTLDHGTWSDQTLAHEDGIRADAAKWLKAYNKRRDGRRALGLLAAYVADEYLLGHEDKADALLAHELKAGRLKSLTPWPGGKAYIKLLKKDLKKWGYVIRRGATL